MDSLEKQLRSWRPRRPSARLKRRLFGPSLAPGAAWFAGSLAPAAACALLTLCVFNSRSGGSVGASGGGLTIASNWSGAASVYMDGFASKQNHWSLVTSDWTNRGSFGSNTVSFRP